MKILLAEDDAQTAAFVAKGLSQAGYTVDTVGDGRDALAFCLYNSCDLVVLDRMMPGMDGLAVLKALRSAGQVMPVLVLTSRSAVPDRVEGLTAGADDDFVKPFQVSELEARIQARIQALLRRPAAARDVTRLQVHDLDLITRAARRAGQAIALQAKEHALLEALMRHPGRLMTRLAATRDGQPPSRALPPPARPRAPGGSTARVGEGTVCGRGGWVTAALPGAGGGRPAARPFRRRPARSHPRARRRRAATDSCDLAEMCPGRKPTVRACDRRRPRPGEGPAVARPTAARSTKTCERLVTPAQWPGGARGLMLPSSTRSEGTTMDGNHPQGGPGDERTALVLGATGGVGGAVAEALAARGWTVRGLARDPARAAAGWRGRRVEWVAGDALARDDVAGAARGARVIVHAVNPPGYRDWDKVVLPMIDNTIAAATAAGARILLPGTIYNFDPALTPVIREDSPQRPRSRKGAVRVEMERRLRAASAQAPALIVRAGDFYGPRVRASWFAQAMVAPGGSVRRVTVLGRAGHGWAYLPDLAEAMARLLDHPGLRPFERVGFEGFWDEDGAQMPALVAAALGLDRLPERAFPWWLMRLLAPLGGFPREAVDILPLWRHPVRIDNARLVELLGEEPRTPPVLAMRATLRGLGCLPGEAGAAGAPSPA